MARVVALVPDLLFGSKVLEMLQSQGHDARLCAQEADARQALAEGADALVVDLASGSLDGIHLAASGGVPALGVYSHVDVATRERAEAAGVTLVVPRSRFVREGPALVERLLAG